MTKNEAPTTTNQRTRAIASALLRYGAAPWVGGRTKGAYTEHGAYVAHDNDLGAVMAAVEYLGWEGVTVVDGGAVYNPASMRTVRVAWIRVERECK